MPMNPMMALGAGVLSAIALYSIAVGSVPALPLFYLAPLPLYMFGLALGGKGVLLSVFGTIVTSNFLGGAIVAAPVAIGYGVPVAMLCRRALEHVENPNGTMSWHPVGGIVASLSAFGASLLAVGSLFMMLRTGAPALQDSVSSILNTALAAMSDRLSAEVRLAFVQELTRFFPGMAAASWLVMHFANAAIGQNILVKLGRNVRPRDTYAALTLPDWLSWVLVGTAFVALVGSGDVSYMAHNLVIVLMVPYFLLGLAVVHLQVRRMNGGAPILFVFYLFLAMFGWASFAVAGIGIVEQWVGIRDKFPADNERESE